MVVVDGNRGTLRAEVTPITVALIGLATIGYGWAVVALERTGGSSLRPLRWLWAAPVVFRLLLTLTEPTLSDDVYRYLWDGHVFSNGVNPYSYAIADPALDSLAIPVRDLANHPTLSSPYLPTLQLLFGALAVIAPSEPTVLQVVMVGFDLAAALVLRSLLSVAGLPDHRVVLYLWHPLVIVESAHGAHFDSLLTFLLLASVAGALRGPTGRPADPRWWSPVVLALGTLTRPLPALAAPVLWWRWRWPHRVLFGVVLAGLVVPFGFGTSGWGLAGESTGAGVFGSARVYADQFRFNAVVAGWIEQLAPTPTIYRVVTVGLMALVLGGVLVSARPKAGAEDRRVLRLLAIPLAAYIVLSPVFHPWYLVSLLAVGVFLAPGPGEWSGRWWLLAPLGYLSASVPLSYLTYVNPDRFGELDWVRAVQWWPTLALAGAAAVMAWRRSAQPTGSQT